ncbi:MAG: aminoglycoside phosphotransferase family protein [bacterium]
MQSTVIEPKPEHRRTSGESNQMVPGPEHESILERIRRLDWRFLLPDPTLRSVAYLGATDTALYRALAEFSDGLRVVPGHSDNQCGSSRCDVLVSATSSLADLERASALLNPGGFLYLEWRRPQPLRSPGRVVRALTHLGFSAINLYWHRPSFASCLDIIPLQDKRVLRYVFSRNSSGVKGILQKAVGHVLMRLRLLARVVPCVSMVAQKTRARGAENGAAKPVVSARADRASNAAGHGSVKGKVTGNPSRLLDTVSRFLLERAGSLDLPRYGGPPFCAPVVATPRFKASAHLIFFILSKEKQQPALIAKVPRIAGDHERLDGEVENLEQIQGLHPEGFDSVPRVVSYETLSCHRVLVETAVAGQTMRPAFVRKHRDLCLEQGLTWLTNFHLATRDGVQKAESADRRIVAHSGSRNDTATLFGSKSAHKSGNHQRLLHEILDSTLQGLTILEQASDSDKTLLAKTQDCATSLQGHLLPLVFEHGDFSSPNLLISEHNALGVVDWELAQRYGLPGVDLFFFLSYIAFATTGASKSQEYLDAFSGAFFGASAWAGSYVQRYCQRLDLDPQVIPPLFVICWSRYLGSLIRRLSLAAPQRKPLSHDTQQWLRANRYYQMWRYTVENLDKLHLMDE